MGPSRITSLSAGQTVPDRATDADHMAIAGFLHGAPCQELTAINFRLEALRRSLSPTMPMSVPAVNLAVSEIMTASRACTMQVRWLIDLLRYDGDARQDFAEVVAAVAAGGAESKVPVTIGCERSVLRPSVRRACVSALGRAVMELRQEGGALARVLVTDDGVWLRLVATLEGAKDGSEQPASVLTRALARLGRDDETYEATTAGTLAVKVAIDGECGGKPE